MQQAQQIINDQLDMPLAIKRSAWILFKHELSRTNPATTKQYTAHKALSNVLKWMAGQKAMLNFKQLTPKERELLVLLLEGLTQKQMALELGCELVTVKQHFSRIRRKVGVISTYQVVAVAVARGWVNAPKMEE